MGSVTEETAVVRELTIAARPETVWEFLVDPDKATRWMGIEATLEPHPGGVYRVTVLPGTSRAARSSRSTRRGASCSHGAGSRAASTGRERRPSPARRRSRSSSSRRVTARICGLRIATCRTPKRPPRTPTAGSTIWSVSWVRLRGEIPGGIPGSTGRCKPRGAAEATPHFWACAERRCLADARHLALARSRDGRALTTRVFLATVRTS